MVKLRNIENIEDIYYKTYSDVIFSTYFISKFDPQRGKKQTEKFEYIENWYNSVNNLNLHAIIFHDNLSQNFIETYQTDRIIFKKVTLGKYSLNDERFILYYMYLCKNKYKKVCSTDISDVIVTKNPFDFIVNKSKLYVGRDRPFRKFDFALSDKSQIEKKLRYFTRNKQILSMPLYNAGVQGGYYDTLQKLYLTMVKLFQLIDSTKNINMVVLNLAIIIKFKNKKNINKLCNKTLFSGYPFNSKFKQYQKSSDAIFIHK